MINPIGTELLYRARSDQEVAGVVSKKTPVAMFSRLRKVDHLPSACQPGSTYYIRNILIKLLT